jgi:hypothetical protein
MNRELEVLENLKTGRKTAWQEYLETTRGQSPLRYREVEPWAWCVLHQQLRTIKARYRRPIVDLAIRLYELHKLQDAIDLFLYLVDNPRRERRNKHRLENAAIQGVDSFHLRMEEILNDEARSRESQPVAA